MKVFSELRVLDPVPLDGVRVPVRIDYGLDQSYPLNQVAYFRVALNGCTQRTAFSTDRFVRGLLKNEG